MQNRKKLYAILLGSALGLGVQAAHANDAANSPAPKPADRSVSQTLDDATITSKVKASLISDDLVKARNINVDTKRGVVTLTGTVASDAELRQALTLARQTSGVVEVQSNLNIGKI